MASTDTNIDPAAERVADTQPKLAVDETKKLTEDVKASDTTTSSESKPTVVQQAAETATAASEAVKSSVFSMFGGGPKKEKKVEEDDVDEPSGSSKAQKAADDEDPEAEADAQYEPVVHLTEKVDTVTHEEAEDPVFKMRTKLFRFSPPPKEDPDSKGQWKEAGTGDVRLLKHKETGKTRLVMRQDKTLKVRANHYIVPDMKLQPNLGSDRAWVWSTSGDVANDNNLPEPGTFAARFANPENANLFKEAFIQAQQENEKLIKAE